MHIRPKTVRTAGVWVVVDRDGVRDKEGGRGVLLPNGSEEREVFGDRSIPVAILPSCQDMKTAAM